MSQRHHAKLSPGGDDGGCAGGRALACRDGTYPGMGLPDRPREGAYQILSLNLHPGPGDEIARCTLRSGVFTVAGVVVLRSADGDLRLKFPAASRNARCCVPKDADLRAIMRDIEVALPFLGSQSAKTARREGFLDQGYPR